MTKRSEPLRDSLRAVAKESIWLTVRYRPGSKPPIALFCTRRGGSTWLMEIIGANRGVLPLNQPLEILTPNLTPHQYKRLPKFDLGQIVHPDPDQERELRAYTDDLMAGQHRQPRRKKMFSAKYSGAASLEASSAAWRST